MLNWLAVRVDANNFSAIHERVAMDNSLMGICGEIAAAVYKKFDNPDGDSAFCLNILQTMLDKGWRWSNAREDIHRLLPLHCQLERLVVPYTERARYYDSSACVLAANTLGNAMTMNGFRALLGSGLRSFVLDGY